MNIHVNPNTIWQATPKQAQLISCPVYEVYYGGARGGGKTDGVLGKCIRHAFDYAEIANIVIFRQTLESLRETMQRAHVLLPMLGCVWKETEKTYKFPNGARLKFAYLESDKDTNKYQGHSYTLICIDEVGNYDSTAVIDKIRATLSRGTKAKSQMVLTGNPGGVGTGWLNERFVSAAPPYTVIKTKFTNPFSGEEIWRDRVYIPSGVNDNPYLGSDYIANLFMSGSKALQRAWVYGDHNVIDGAYFDEWDNQKHIIRPFRIPDHWNRYRCMDWGTAKPSAVYWAAEVPADYLHLGRWLLPKGCLVIYRELYTCVQGKPNTGTKVTITELADQILEYSQDENITIGWADPAIFNDTGLGKLSDAMAMKGVYWQSANNTRVDPARKARSSTIIGWDAFRQRLRGIDGNPLTVFFETCVHAIRTIPILQHDPIHLEDLNSKQEDHAADALRYLYNARSYDKISHNTNKVTFSGAHQHYR